MEAVLVKSQLLKALRASYDIGMESLHYLASCCWLRHGYMTL